MDHIHSQNYDLKIICPADCGNAPKRNYLKEFNITLAQNNIEYIDSHIVDDFHWNIIGKASIKGKGDFPELLKQIQNSPMIELRIHTIITHGYDGSINGTFQLANKKIYAFSNVFTFKSSRNNSPIKECISYIIELK